jgi:hypothetical protein
MSRSLRCLLLSLAVLPLPLHHSVHAQGENDHDFTFEIPVELANLPPQFVGGSVTVMVLGGQPDFEHSGWTDNTIASTIQNFPITPDETQDTIITVALDSDPYKQAGNAVFYYVQLNLRTIPNPPIDPGGVSSAANATRLDGPYPYDPSKPYVTWFWDYLPGHTGPKQVPFHPEAWKELKILK